MKKENIYELITSAYSGKNQFNRYVNKFIRELKDDGYFEMADIITNIKKNNSIISFASKPNNELKIYGSKIEYETKLISMGYKTDITKSLLLYGRPGTGKTKYVELLSKKMNLKVTELKLSQVMDSRYGESIKKLENFMITNISTQQIIFIDEAEALFSSRGNKNDVFENDRLLTIMLKMMDKERKALIIMSTNLIKSIDKAIIRRFDWIVNFDDINIDITKFLEDMLLKYAVKYTDKNLSDWSRSIKKIIKCNFSDINFIAKKIALMKMTNGKLIEIKEYIEEYVETLNEERVLWVK